MQRRTFITLLGSALAVSPLTAHAQPTPGRPLIGILSPSTAAATANYYEVLRQGLREAGYVEGRNLHLEFRYANGAPARLPALAAQLVALKPDIILASSAPSVVAAHDATRTIPIVMVTLLDPVALGVVKSIARPGGNVTGVWTAGGQDALVGKRIGLLKEIVPALSRIGIMISSTDATNEIVVQLLPVATRALGMTHKFFHVGSTAELDTAFAQASRDGLQGLFIDQSPFFLVRRAEVAALAAREGLPAIYGYREHAEAGGLMAYGSSLSGAYTQVARLVANILKGAKPAELPVEQAAKFELVINNKTAKVLGVKISEAFLLNADEVIE